MTYEEMQKQLNEKYDRVIADTLRELKKKKPLTKQKLAKALFEANKRYWTARLALLDDTAVVEAERFAKTIAAPYANAAGQLADEVRRVFSGYQSAFDLTKKDAADLLEHVVYDRSIADNLRTMAAAMPDGEEKTRVMAELSAPAYRHRMQRAEQIAQNAQETLERIAKNEVDKERVFLQTQTERAYNISFEEAQRLPPSEAVIFDLSGKPAPEGVLPRSEEVIREYTPTTEKGIGDSFSLINDRAVQEIIDHDWKGSNFSERVWANTDELTREVKQVLLEGELTGASEAEMARKIEERFQVSMYKARRVIRTESNYCTNQAELKAMKDAGFDDYEFITLGENAEGVCDMCDDLDGQRFKISDATVGVNFPPMHPFCRCKATTPEETLEDIQADIDRMLGDMSIEEIEQRLDMMKAEQVQIGTTDNSAEGVDNSENSGIMEEKEPLSVYDEYEQNRDAINVTLHQVEKEKEHLNYEVGTIIDRTGKVINVTGGEAHSVEPPKDLLVDNIFTHNHPSGGCFSFNDINNAIKDKVLELRASTPQGIYYSLLRTAKATDNLEFANEYKKVVSWTNASKMISNDLKLGIISKNDVNDALYIEYASRAGESYLEKNAEKYGYVFTMGVR